MKTGKIHKTGTAKSQTKNLTSATFRKNKLKNKRVRKLNQLLSKVRPPKVGK